MLLSQILAWITAFFCVMEVLRFAARISKVKSLNRFFHRIHIPFGVLMIVFGGVHGVLAGNFPDASPAGMEWAPVLFTPNWGTAVYLCALLLALTYLLRKALKRRWITLHRILTAAALAFLVLHLLDVGITLPKALFPAKRPVSSGEAAEPVASAMPRPVLTLEPADTAAPTPTPEPESASEAKEEPTPEPTPEPVLFSGAVLADGVYEGTAIGRNGPVGVSVTVSGGEVADLTVTDHAETPKYYSRAEEVIPSILGYQSLEVDAVSGATVTSDAIKYAVYDALQSAVISGELSVW